ncbi:MAG: penicillin-binding protein activator [Thiotrichales bacterium]|nr:penicillin-binding protein activator [Thiotrichales bacterium]
MKWLSLLLTLLFSAAILANPQVRIYNDSIHLSPADSSEKPSTSSESANAEGKKAGEASGALSGDLPRESSDSTKLPLDLQIKRIDAEILLLKAELARKNGIPSHVRAYLDSLGAVDKAAISHEMQLRIEGLQQYLQQTASTSIQDNSDALPFNFDGQNIAVLLPLTGDYSQIGLAIQKGIQEAFPNTKLKFYDTEVFDSMLDLWNLMKLSQPTFIIGPLRPGKAQVLNDLDTKVPTLLLNQIDSPKSYVRCLSLSREGYVPVLVKQLVEHQFKGISVIVDSSTASQDLLQSFETVWADYAEKYPDTTKSFRVHIQQVDHSMDQAVGDLVNASQSNIRKNWLQTVIKHKLHFDERSRQDLDAVVSFVSARQAVQVSPLLNFYHLGTVQHYWLPSKLPTVKDFNKSMSYWRNTYALLPKYFVDQVRAFAKGSLKDDQQVGIFHAFGSLAAKVAQSINDSSVRSLPSELGEVMLDEHRAPVILPEEFWLNKGSFSVVQFP